MNRTFRRAFSRAFSRNPRHALARILTASILAVAGTHLVEAQQPATPQNGSTTTRAAKKAELKKLEQNGYKPQATDSEYPQDIQNAEKKANGGTPAPRDQSGQ